MSAFLRRSQVRFLILFAGINLTVNGVIEARETEAWSWWATLFFCLGALCLSVFVALTAPPEVSL